MNFTFRAAAPLKETKNLGVYTDLHDDRLVEVVHGARLSLQELLKL